MQAQNLCSTTLEWKVQHDAEQPGKHGSGPQAAQPEMHKPTVPDDVYRRTCAEAACCKAGTETSPTWRTLVHVLDTVGQPLHVDVLLHNLQAGRVVLMSKQGQC